MVSGCINGPMDVINNEISSIENAINEGNSYYNESVDIMNNNNYSNALSKAKLATVEYDNALKSLLEIKGNYSETMEEVQVDYIDLLYSEVSLKSDANNNLITAIDYYNNGDDELGNEYASKANDLMNQAVDLKNSRDNLANNNPDYFNLKAI